VAQNPKQEEEKRVLEKKKAEQKRMNGMCYGLRVLFLVTQEGRRNERSRRGSA